MSVITTMLMMQAAHRHRLVANLRERGAVSPETAVAVESLPDTKLDFVQMLHKQGVLQVTPDGRVHLDVARIDATARGEARFAQRVLMVMVPVLLVFLVWVVIVLVK